MATSQFTLDLRALCNATGGTAASIHATQFTGLEVAIDSRTTNPGNIFFAIRGEHFDGHDFIPHAIHAGATAIVCEPHRLLPPTQPPLPTTTIVVPDTRAALAQLAHHMRRMANVCVIAITGSSGKTTTKDILATLLRAATSDGAVLASLASLNNETGVPITLLKLRPHHRYAVVEMGMRGLGQIDFLTQIAEPNIGIVTNVGLAHIGLLGSPEAIAEGKSEIWNHLAPPAVAIYPHNDDRLRPCAQRRSPQARHLTFGTHPDATVVIDKISPRGPDGTDATFIVGEQAYPAFIPLVGKHNTENTACALCAIIALGLNPQRALVGLRHLTPPSQRSQITCIGGRYILLDCYNANPASMQAALTTLADLAAGTNSVAVLGDMLELGDSEVREHLRIGALLPQYGIGSLIAVGERAQHYAQGAAQAGMQNITCVATADDAAQVLVNGTQPGDWVLIKASRAMQLEQVAEHFQKLVESP